MEVITTLKKRIGICVNAFDRARNLLSDSDIVLEVHSAQKTHDFFAEPSERASTGVGGVEYNNNGVPPKLTESKRDNRGLAAQDYPPIYDGCPDGSKTQQTNSWVSHISARRSPAG